MLADRILIVRLSAIGDVLNALPAVWALRRAHPSAHLAWLVEDKARDAVEGQPGIDEVIVFERRRWSRGGPAGWAEALAWARALRARRFDVSVDLQGNLKSATMALLAGAPVRIGASPGFTSDLAWLAANVHAAPRARRQGRVWHHVDLLAPLGVTREAVAGAFHVAGPALARMEAALAGVRRPRVLLHPGTSRFGAFKRWPVRHFADLAGRLQAALGAEVLVGWGPGEEDLARAVVSEASYGARLAPATGSLGALAALLRCVDVFVGADSAPLHLSGLVGTPAVGLFGPKDPAIYAPVLGAHEVLVEDLPCRPCGLRRCLWTTGADEPSPCMDRLDPARVLDAVVRLLKVAGR